ncbi:MAG TPA: EF-P beta-lysylation protein EpmB, partial [Nitrospiraceae bacterium]|nr:EF-P beta-lysylation protein EpmB [Nitrospiraceae bacterium]
ANGFPIFAPASYVAKINPADPLDPLLLQILPQVAELVEHASFTADPVGDLAAAPAPGLLHKYHGRVLLIATGACAIHCRYCFRRHFPYAVGPRSLAEWQPALDYIASDKSIDEVILSGGDPLTLVDAQLAELVEAVEEIPHVRRLRVHTRLPIVIPERVTDSLLQVLTAGRLQPILVVHANHPRELVGDVAAALNYLSEARVLLLNQAVLLRGINDDIETLIELCQRLVELRVQPYYLHQLDRVAGGTHFEVPIERGLELMQSLRARLPGYAVPRYVQEVAGETNKRVLA